MVDPGAFVLNGTRGARTRSRLLAALVRDRGSVEELAADLDLDPAEIREHLAVLQENELVEVHERPDGPVYVADATETTIPTKS